MNAFEDNPILNVADDRFNRKPIVDTISTFIKRRKSNPNCFTIGIYGKWGEGKTTVLNMIEEEIKQEQDIVITKFNPWLFNDQESLLFEFFNSIAGERIDEKFVKAIKQYGPAVAFGIKGLVSFFAPGMGSIASSIFGKFMNLKNVLPELSDRSISDRKKDINKIIKDSGKHLVFIIDDIDRLDRDETHSLLKLIKQNADFANSTFILSMDVDMVSSAIGARFESGNDVAGRNFIDKIVQMPIVLPKIQPSDTEKILLERYDEILSGIDIDIEVDKKELESSRRFLSEKIVPILRTGRDITQYSNALSFSLPILFGEVSLDDLLALEALRLFYPTAYNQIRDSRNIILHESEGLFHLLGKPEFERSKYYKDRAMKFKESLYPENKDSHSIAIKVLIDDLVRMASDMDNAGSRGISSRFYYDKYFCYDTPQRFIPRKKCLELGRKINLISQQELSDEIDKTLSQYDRFELTRMLKQVLYYGCYLDITNDTIAKICVSLAMMEVNKERKYTLLGNDVDPIEYIISDICNYIRLESKSPAFSRPKDKTTLYACFNEICSKAPIIFTIILLEKIIKDFGWELDLKEIVRIAMERYVSSKEKDETPLSELGYWDIKRTLKYWKEVDEESYNTYLEEDLYRDDFDILRLVDNLMAELDGYDTICDLFDVDRIYNMIIDPKYDDKRGDYQGVSKFIDGYDKRFDEAVEAMLEEKQLE